MALGGLDDDGARRLIGAVERRCPPEFRIQLNKIIGDQAWLVADVRCRSCAWLSGTESNSPTAATTVGIKHPEKSVIHFSPACASYQAPVR